MSYVTLIGWFTGCTPTLHVLHSFPILFYNVVLLLIRKRNIIFHAPVYYPNKWQCLLSVFLVRSPSSSRGSSLANWLLNLDCSFIPASKLTLKLLIIDIGLPYIWTYLLIYVKIKNKLLISIIADTELILTK